MDDNRWICDSNTYSTYCCGAAMSKVILADEYKIQEESIKEFAEDYLTNHPLGLWDNVPDFGTYYTYKTGRQLTQNQIQEFIKLREVFDYPANPTSGQVSFLEQLVEKLTNYLKSLTQ